MRNGAKWNLLKHLLGDKPSKASQQLTIDRLIHKLKSSGSTDTEITDDLAARYLCTDPSSPADYPPAPDAIEEDPLGTPFTFAEVKAVLAELNCRSAPGPDGIQNKLLKNFAEADIELLTEHINKIWEASVILIPKPGKPLALGSLRPISLTSCVGKVAEHVILKRVTKFVEERQILPLNQIGFRPSMSTQDVMLMLKHELLDKLTRDTRAILALDLEKAFDRVKHSHILASIREAGLGTRFYNYVSSFLRDRTATLQLGSLGSRQFNLGPRGTPQGAVISPFLFNLSMRELSRQLSQIDGIGHAFYADDITVWCTGGNDGRIEERLQDAVNTVQAFLRQAGLSLSAEKSELLLYRPKYKARKDAYSDINLLTADGSPIPTVGQIRILGMIIEANGSNAASITRISKKAEAMAKLINRVANKRGGLSEENLRRLFHAFLMSHINYIAPAHMWQKGDENRLDVIIRRCVKQVLGLPGNTRTVKINELGIHNTFNEIVEAQKLSQLVRLSSTEAGRRLLVHLGLKSPVTEQRQCQLPEELRAKFTVSPIPRNMHPAHNVGRRQARARALLSTAAAMEDNVAFVDAAQYGRSDHFVSVVTTLKGDHLSSLTLLHANADRAEQVAVALALAATNRTAIYTDSRAAARAFMTGSVCREAARVLSAANWTDKKHIIWFPAHVGRHVHGTILNANELVHSRARGLTFHAGENHSEAEDANWYYRDPLLTFHEICKHYHLERRKFPLPHPHLNRAQSITLRLLQTEAYASPLICSKYMDGIEPGCPRCGSPRCTLQHMLWQCPALRESPGSPSTEEDWRHLLTSKEKEDQLRAIQRAHDMAEEMHLPVPSWVRPADVAP